MGNYLTKNFPSLHQVGDFKYFLLGLKSQATKAA